MLTLSMKAHYLTKSFEGFENILGTKITSVRPVPQQPELLELYAWVNPTNESLAFVEKVEATILYNMDNGTYKIKLAGKGARKHAKRCKWDLEGIIDFLVIEAGLAYENDCKESLDMTTAIYHDELKEAGFEVAVLNELYVQANRMNTVQEISEWVAPLLATVEPEEEKEGETFIMHPVSKLIVPEDSFQMFEDWKQVTFIQLKDCKVLEDDKNYTLTGKIDGIKFESILSRVDYFEGKFFTNLSLVFDSEQVEPEEEEEEEIYIEPVEVTSMGDSLKDLAIMILERNELSSKYGWASCIDYPDEYQRMANIYDELLRALENKYPKTKDGYSESRFALQMYDTLEAIAIDFSNGADDLDSIESISFYSLDDYIDDYVLNGMDEEGRKMFDSLYYFMDSDSRKAWLEATHLAHDPNIYTTEFMDYILIVNN